MVCDFHREVNLLAKISLLLGKCEANYLFSKKPTTGPHPNKYQTNQHPHTTFPYYRPDFYHFIFSYQYFPIAIFDKYFRHFYIGLPYYLSRHFDCPCREKKAKVKE